jgi:hypothetical protein
MKNRRRFLESAAASLIATRSLSAEIVLNSSRSDARHDEAKFIGLYDVDRSVTNLEEAY